MKITFTHAKQTFHLDAERSARGVEIRIDDTRIPVHVLADAAPHVTFVYDDVTHTARVVSDGKRRWVHWNGRTLVLERGEADRSRPARIEREGIGSGIVTAPMPGQVRELLVQSGDWVQEGQPLLLLEAMKMEIRVTAARAGQIVQLDVRMGQTVEREQVLAKIQPANETDG